MAQKRLGIRDYYNVSTAIAIPMPPPTHNDAMPRFLPVLSKAYTNVTNTRAPKIKISQIV